MTVASIDFCYRVFVIAYFVYDSSSGNRMVRLWQALHMTQLFTRLKLNGSQIDLGFAIG